MFGSWGGGESSEIVQLRVSDERSALSFSRNDVIGGFGKGQLREPEGR